MKKAEKIEFSIPMTKEDQRKLESEKRKMLKTGRFVEFMFIAV